MLQSMNHTSSRFVNIHSNKKSIRCWILVLNIHSKIIHCSTLIISYKLSPKRFNSRH